MARFRTTNWDMTCLLPTCCLVGRSWTCQLRVETPETSSEHALLRWQDDGWELHDLYSHNGTYVDGAPIGAGRTAPLREGSRVGFGLPDQWQLVDAGPPHAHAVLLAAPHLVVEAVDGVIALPDLRRHGVTLQLRERRWWRSDGERSVADGEVIVVDGGAWRLHLPEALPPTRDVEGSPLTLATLDLRFTVHEGGEPVELDVRRGERRVDLKSRAHHAPLLALALARARLADRGRPIDAQGWIDQAALLDLLRCDANRLHVDVHRVRRQFAAAGVVDAMNIVERREDGRALRIGVTRLEVTERA